MTSCDAMLLQLGRIMRCPSCKFIMHTISHLIFLILLAAATFRLEDKRYQINSTNDLTDFRNIDVPPEERMESLIKGIFRPANILVTHVQVCLVFYVLGKCLTRTHARTRIHTFSLLVID